MDINGVPIRGEFLVVEPPRRLVFSRAAAGNNTLPPRSPPSRSSCTPTATAPCSSSAHRDLPAAEVAQHGVDWGQVLARLAIASTGASAGPDPWATH
jgi:hypothetical protein